MSEYTPGTNEVRFNYTTYEAEHTRRGLSGADESEFDAEFDRWLAEERWKAILDYEMNRKVSITVENIDGKAARKWHAEEIRKAKAEALRESAKAVHPSLGTSASGHISTYSVRQWLRQRAADIENGGQR